MAKFLTSEGCTNAIIQMVREAKDELWLISPYIQIADNVMELLERKNRHGGIDMRLVYREKAEIEQKSGRRARPLHAEDSLRKLGNLRVYRRPNLHAKCYMSENEALVTSLNLYEYSQVNNDEWGILVSKQDDANLYQEIHDEAKEIFESQRTELVFGAPSDDEIPSSVKAPEVARQPTTARTPSGAPADDGIGARIPDSLGAWGSAPADEITEFAEGVFFENDRSAPADDIIVYHADETMARTPSAPAAQTKTAKRPRKRTADRKPSLPKTGVCVRDGGAIDFDILKPYCDKCFRSWNRYKNREYKEEKCHACGRDWETDIDRPLCLDCYRKHRDMIAARA